MDGIHLTLLKAGDKLGLHGRVAFSYARGNYRSLSQREL